MVKVATGFDAPIKILMPQILTETPRKHCSLLGLGDIVIPGLFIGFAFRFEKFIHNFKSAEVSYGVPTLVAYSLALITCGACMVIFKSAQPALLYISPALLVTVITLAAKNKHLSDMRHGIDVEMELKKEREAFKYNTRSTEQSREEHIRRIETELAESSRLETRSEENANLLKRSGNDHADDDEV